MHLRDIMCTEVETVDGQIGAASAWDRMRDLGIRHLVVTRGREIQGVVSDRDLAACHGDDPRALRPVRELMTEDVVTALPTTTVREAANLLRGRVIGCLPVLDARGRLAGIVTTSDLLDLIGRGAERPVEKAERRNLRRRGPRRRPVLR